MASSMADWVFGEARLISSPSTMAAKIGPGRNSNVPCWRFPAGHPARSPGRRAAGDATPHADDVGGQQVRRELHPPEAGLHGPGEGLGKTGLADAGDVFDQEVSLRDEAQHDEVDDFGLSLDDVADVVGDGLEDVGEGRCRRLAVEVLGCRHVLVLLLGREPSAGYPLRQTIGPIAVTCRDATVFGFAGHPGRGRSFG